MHQMHPMLARLLPAVRTFLRSLWKQLAQALEVQDTFMGMPLGY